MDSRIRDQILWLYSGADNALFFAIALWVRNFAQTCLKKLAQVFTLFAHAIQHLRAQRITSYHQHSRRESLDDLHIATFIAAL